MDSTSNVAVKVDAGVNVVVHVRPCQRRRSNTEIAASPRAPDSPSAG